MNGEAHYHQYLRADAATSSAGARLALYSHDAMGVGHVRRNLLIAQALSDSPLQATSLMLCGVHEANLFACGNGIGCMTLPSLRKYENDDYRSRDLRLSFDDVYAIRQATLDSALQAFRPDILLVDKLPRGLYGELETVIPRLRARGTRIVFGMRDVLDSTERVVAEWNRQRNVEFIRRHFDAVWVYGDPDIFDPIKEYQLFEIQDKVRYTGYIDQRERLRYLSTRPELTDEQIARFTNAILLTVGGGEDGLHLALAFANSTLPTGRTGVIVAGPLMAQEDLCRLESAVAGRTDMHLLSSLREADQLTAIADRVICMGGYNSAISVISFGKPALIVPRISPRKEQLIRAERFAQRGLVDLLHPSVLSPDSLAAWLARPVQRVNGESKVRLDGLNQIAQHASELLAGPAPTMTSPLELEAY